MIIFHGDQRLKIVGVVAPQLSKIDAYAGCSWYLHIDPDCLGWSTMDLHLGSLAQGTTEL